MIARLLLSGFLLAHALIHAGFVSARPPATAGGPAWPFDLGRSWLSPLAADPGIGRVVGLALVAVTIAAFASSAVFALGIVPGLAWGPAAATGAIASLGLLVLAREHAVRKERWRSAWHPSAGRVPARGPA